jgi:hypothetical protein
MDDTPGSTAGQPGGLRAEHYGASATSPMRRFFVPQPAGMSTAPEAVDHCKSQNLWWIYSPILTVVQPEKDSRFAARLTRSTGQEQALRAPSTGRSVTTGWDGPAGPRPTSSFARVSQQLVLRSPNR